jgi:hypothetical protein
MITEVSPFSTTVLDGVGNGQTFIGPPHGTRWLLNLANVSTTSTVNQPTCTLFRGSQSAPNLAEPVDSTNTGNQAATGKAAAVPFFAGQGLWAVWAGGDAGAVATLRAYGQQRGRADPPFELLPVTEGFNSIPTSLVIGSPNGARRVLGASPIPPELIAYYQTTYFVIIEDVDLIYINAKTYKYNAFFSNVAGQFAIATGWGIFNEQTGVRVVWEESIINAPRIDNLGNAYLPELIHGGQIGFDSAQCLIRHTYNGDITGFTGNSAIIAYHTGGTPSGMFLNEQEQFPTGFGLGTGVWFVLPGSTITVQAFGANPIFQAQLKIDAVFDFLVTVALAGQEYWGGIFLDGVLASTRVIVDARILDHCTRALSLLVAITDGNAHVVDLRAQKIVPGGAGQINTDNVIITRMSLY